MRLRSLLAVAILLLAGRANARVLRVPDEYASPQAAVDEALAGDVVSVAEGVYDPPRLAVGGVTLMGAGLGTIFTQEIALRGVDGVVLSGFQLRGGTDDHHFGVVCEDARDIVIRGVAVTGFHHGISAERSTALIADCEIAEAVNVAILVTQGSSVVVENVVAGADSGVGVFVSDCPDRTEVRGSVFRGALLVGVRAANADLTVRETRIEGNPVGVEALSGRVDLGRDDDPGRNVIRDNEIMDVFAARGVVVEARGVYWGPGGEPDPERLSGAVEVFPWLANDPADTRALSRRARLATRWARLKAPEAE